MTKESLEIYRAKLELLLEASYLYKEALTLNMTPTTKKLLIGIIEDRESDFFQFCNAINGSN